MGTLPRGSALHSEAHQDTDNRLPYFKIDLRGRKLKDISNQITELNKGKTDKN